MASPTTYWSRWKIWDPSLIVSFSPLYLQGWLLSKPCGFHFQNIFQNFYLCSISIASVLTWVIVRREVLLTRKSVLTAVCCSSPSHHGWKESRGPYPTSEAKWSGLTCLTSPPPTHLVSCSLILFQVCWSFCCLPAPTPVSASVPLHYFPAQNSLTLTLPLTTPSLPSTLSFNATSSEVTPLKFAFPPTHAQAHVHLSPSHYPFLLFSWHYLINMLIPWNREPNSAPRTAPDTEQVLKTIYGNKWIFTKCLWIKLQSIQYYSEIKKIVEWRF